MVFGQFTDAQRAGTTRDPAMAEGSERVTTSPRAGGLLLVPHRTDGMDTSALPVDYQAITKIVTAASEPVPAKDISFELRVAGHAATFAARDDRS